jgi:hypothetical protein
VLLVCTMHSVLNSEIALSRKPFGIGHMYIYTFLLRMTDTVTSQNIDLSSWDTLYKGLVCLAGVERMQASTLLYFPAKTTSLTFITSPMRRQRQ